MSAILDWMFGVNDAVELGRELDAKISELNKSYLDSGKWTQAQYNAAMQNLENSSAENYSTWVETAFDEGYNNAFNQITSGIKSAIIEPIRFGLNSIPPVVWIGLIAFVVYKAGAFKQLFDHDREN